MPFRRQRRWIVVFDGASARILEQDGAGLRLLESLQSDEARKPSHEIASDRPGRMSDGATGGRHPLTARSDPHRHAKRDFARSLARRLNDEATGNSFDSIILVAAPKSLGDLRSGLARATMDRVEAQFAKDLIREPEPALATHLDRMLEAR